MTTLPRFLLFFFLASVGAALAAAQTASTGTAAAPAGPASTPQFLTATDPSYHLSIGDQISVSIDDEPELTANELIDRAGVAKLRLINETKLAGLTVREAEAAIEKIYVQRDFLKKPVVRLVVTAFVPREVIVNGEVRSPGTITFPRDLTSLDITQVIIRAGGFTVRAKSREVTVTRRSADGSKETSFQVDVEKMMNFRGTGEQKRVEFPIYPGDLINVTDRLF